MTDLRVRAVAGLVPFFLAAAAALSASAEPVRVAKDVGPASAACDTHGKGTPRWKACVGAASARMSDTELFYAGYWLAKSGQYAQALTYLELSVNKDERVLTYIGFATRKLGDVDAALPLYASALRLNPDYSVARAYLGEALLFKGEPDRARAQLLEIEKRCGTSCAEYADLAGHIARFKMANGERG